MNLQISDLDDVIEQIDNLVEEVMERAESVKPRLLGIDSRASHIVYVFEDRIAIPSSNRRSFDYYAGGEYVNEEYVSELGGYVFYHREDNRVDGWISNYEESEVEE